MNIDNQLLLGIVFITAGVAMGLLAYAAFLNRQQAEEEEMDLADQTSELPGEEQGDEPVAAPIQDESAAQEAEPEELTEVAAPLEPMAEPQPVSGSESGLHAPETITSSDRDQAPETVSAVPAGETAMMEQPTVLVDRNQASGRLMVKVNDRVYHSMESLRDSNDWDQVTDLFSDLLAWMIKANEEEQAEDETSVEETPHRPISMVQEINQILSEKLADVDSGPAAVRLMEGAGGSIRVYIGVESYAIEEVPDDKVKALIRQAVAEWEERQ
jgi:hypothetical protein